MRKKIFSVLILIVLLLNSSLLTIISTAVDDVKVTIENAKTESTEKISMDLSYTQLTNKVQNDLVITGVIGEKYEKPVITFELPKEVERVIVNSKDIDLFYYDGELNDNNGIKECSVIDGEEGNKIIKVELDVSTKSDATIKGTTIRVPVSIILKQDINTTTSSIKMICEENTCEKEVKLINFMELETRNGVDQLLGTTFSKDGLSIETRAILGDTILNDGDIIHENEIIKYEVKVTNTTQEKMENVKIVCQIPKGMTYVELHSSDSIWVDEFEYVEDKNVTKKEKEIVTLEAGQTESFYYEVKVDSIDTRTLKDRVLAKFFQVLEDKTSQHGGIDNISSDEYFELAREAIREIMAVEKSDATEEEIQQVTDEVFEVAFSKEDESIKIVNDKHANPDYEEQIETIISVLVDNVEVTKSSIKHIAKIGEFEVTLKSFEDRTSRNKWAFEINLKNITNEKNSAVLTFELPSTLRIFNPQEDIYSTTLILNEETNTWEKEKLDYEIKDGKLIVRYNEIKGNATKKIRIIASIVNMEETEDCLYELKLAANAESSKGVTYKSNQNVINGGIEAIKVSQTSDKSGEQLKQYDELTYIFNIENIGHVIKEMGEYTSVNFEDYIPNGLEVVSVEYNDNDVSVKTVDSKTEYTITPIQRSFNNAQLSEANQKDSSEGARIKMSLRIKTGETSTITIKAKVRTIKEEKDEEEIIENYAMVTGDNIKTKQSNIVTNLLQGEKQGKPADIVVSQGKVDPKPENPKPSEDGKPTPTPTPDTEAKKHEISGIAWVDENEDGRRDSNEKLKSGIKVMILDAEKNTLLKDESGNIISKTTDDKGEYKFSNIPEGKYYVVFEYNADEYNITEYHKSTIDELTDCDVIAKKIALEGEEKLVGLTNTITLNTDKKYIDIGLVENKVFDLKIDQYIKKITVVNSKGTKEYDYNNKKFAKIEIHSKLFNSSTVAIEYKIVVTNVGEVAGTVNEIIDEIPEKLDFHSELNSDWSKSMTYNVSNTSFGTKEIKPGESIETTLVLSKNLTNDSAGEVLNVTKIGISDNSKHITDSNTENDKDSTQVILGISTGAKTYLTIIGTIIGLFVIALEMIIMMKKMPKKINKKVLFLIAFIIIFSMSSCMNFSRALNIGSHDSDGDGHYTEHTDENGNSWECQDPGMPSCSLGHPYTYDHTEVVSTYNIYPDYYAGGKQQGNISLSGDLTMGDTSSSFEIAASVSDTTGAPGSISIDVTCTGGGGSGSLPEGGGTTTISCSGSDVIMFADVVAHKHVEGTYTHVEIKKDVYEGTPEVHIFSEGHPHSCTSATPVYKDVEITVDTYDPETGEKKQEKITEQQLDHWDYEALEIQRMAVTYEVRTEVPFSFDCEAKISFGPSYFTRPVTPIKVDPEGFGTLGGSADMFEFDIGGNSVKSGETVYLYNGSYTATETYAPNEIGYYVVDSISFTVENNRVTVTFENIQYLHRITVNKKDPETGKTLDGVIFEVDGKQYTTPFTSDYIVLGPDGTKDVLVKEIYNPYYGYVNDEYSEVITLTFGGSKHDITILDVENRRKYLRLTGYVWEDMLEGKGNVRDNLYGSNDKLVPGVKVMLYCGGTLVGTTWTDENGAYSFGSRNGDGSYSSDSIEIAKLDQYYVVFEYNGMKYENVDLRVDLENGSKAAEGDNRGIFNKNFATITSKENPKTPNGETTGGIAIDASGNIKYDDIEYYQDQEYTSKVDYSGNKKSSVADYYGLDKYHITATTNGYYSFGGLYPPSSTSGGSLTYDESVDEATIKNINLGMFEREQVDAALRSDVKQLDLSINDYHHIYTYGTINPNLEDEMGVILKELKGKYYERQLHESSIVYSADKDGSATANGDVYADITYKIFLQNKSSSLKTAINELVLHYDGRLKCISYNYEGKSVKAITETQQGVDIKQLTLNLKELDGFGYLDSGTQQVVEVTFRADAAVIATILNKDDGLKFDFMAEIKSYSTLSSDGEIYASIDKNSAPGNVKTEVDPADKFITDTHENDTTMAPTFILRKGSQTIITGTVYEDGPEDEKLKNNERIGNGIFDADESVMYNAKVELLKLPIGVNEIYDSTSARDNTTSRHTYELAKLYKVGNDGKSTEIGDAVTYTDKYGNYTFEGVIADDYVIRYTYGEGIGGEGNSTYIYKDGNLVKNDAIKAREYKSTIITSDYIRNAANIQDGVPHLNGDVSWFLNDKEDGETRYSDAVDDVEYRAYLEKDATLNLSNLNDSSKYAYSSMESYTPFFKLGVEENDNQNDKATIQTDGAGHLDYEFILNNVDFGLIERPIVDIQVDKQITNVKVTLGNGQVPIEGDPSKDNLPYVKSRLDDFVPIEIDTEIMEGATLKQQYTISITNNSELDYPIYDETTNTDVTKSRNYYYFGDVGDYAGDKISTKLDVLVDYVSQESDIDLEEMQRNGWEIKKLEDLYQENAENNLITKEVANKLEDGNYKIFTTRAFAQEGNKLVTIGETQSISYEVSRLLTSKDEMKYTNDTEILQYLGYSQNKDKTENTYNRLKDTTPGNLIPEYAKEDDEDSVRTTITPPTGVIISKTIYIITALTGLMIIVLGVIFIRRRILCK